MTKKVSVIGLFTAMALLLSCIENLLPFRTGIPGIKLGIANLIIVIAFYFLPFLSLHEKKAVYTVLVNTEKEGGASASEYMGTKVTAHPKMIIPYDKEDAAYTAHTEEIAALFKDKGYAVETRPYDTLMFRSLVHSGRFDLVLLEKRVSP